MPPYSLTFVKVGSPFTPSIGGRPNCVLKVLRSLARVGSVVGVHDGDGLTLAFVARGQEQVDAISLLDHRVLAVEAEVEDDNGPTAGL